MAIAFDDTDLDSASDVIVKYVKSKKSGYAVTPNTEILARVLCGDVKLSEALNRADLVLCDGIGVSVAALFKGYLLRRVTGIDLAWELLSALERENIPLYLYGSKEGVAKRAKMRLLKFFPCLEICGISCGYDDEEAVLEKISRNEACVVLVGTSSPKQEYFSKMATERLLGKGIFFLCVGGALDVFSGDKKRAPKILRILGLEWAYRFAKEPYRIKRFAKVLTNTKKT